MIRTLAYEVDPLVLVDMSTKIEVGPKGWSLLFLDEARHRERAGPMWRSLGVADSDMSAAPASALTRSEVVSIGREIVSLLARKDWIDENDARPLAGQKLVVTKEIEPQQLISLFNGFNRHATVCRAAEFDAQGRRLMLFHLRDDPQRGSSLRPFLAATVDQRIAVLNAYRTDQGTVFLPKAPPSRTIAAVAVLMQRAPALFGFAEMDRERQFSSNLLFGLSDAGDQQDARVDVLHDLRGVHFFGSEAFLQSNRPQVLLGTQVKNPLAAADAMAKRLADPASRFSRSIRLVTGAALPDLAATDREAVRLRAEIDKSRRRLEFLERRATAPAIYAVADETGLQALAEVLRTSVLYRETWQGVQYGCLAHAETGHLRHVFAFEPSWFANLRRVANAPDQPGLTWYWSEPTWLRHYRTGAKVAVAVPIGTQMVPFPHSWTPRQIDDHLLEMLAVWSGGTLSLTAEDQPTLLFSSPEGRGVQLTVVRPTDLAPLTGSTLAWLNDVQVVQEAARRPEDVKRRAIEIELEELALGFAAGGPPASAEREIAAVVDDLREGTARLQGAIADEIQRMRSWIEGQSTDARTVSAEIADIALRYADLTEEARQLRALHDKIVGDITPAARATPYLARSLAEDIDRSRQKFDRDIGRVTASLGTMRSALRAFQSTALFWWRKR